MLVRMRMARGAIALSSVGLAFALGTSPAAALPWTDPALPAPVGGKKATVVRDSPGTALYEGKRYKTFKVSMAIEESDYKSIYRILIVYVDCDRKVAAIHNSYTDVYSIDGDGQSNPLVSEYLEFEDQTVPDAVFGKRNLKMMCRLK